MFKSAQLCNEQKAAYPEDSEDQKRWDDYKKCKPISAYFNENVTQDQIDSSIKQIEKIKGVYRVEYISSDEMAKSSKDYLAGADPY